MATPKHGARGRIRHVFALEILGNRSVFKSGGVEPNPRFETLMKAVAIAKREQVDFLLAVGGGSVIDGTKFVAIATKYGGENPAELLKYGFTPTQVAYGIIDAFVHIVEQY